ncbi:phage minor tail protein G [Proteus mirabilis]|uniref:phage minor tail protein domain-containing protein n=1 Tax=Proteus mirabilis TaxID=584 RepID=UPI00331613EC
MFLKKKEFTYSDNTIELFELSALQRIEYFDFLVEQSQKNEDVEKAEGIKKQHSLFVQTQNRMPG